MSANNVAHNIKRHAQDPSKRNEPAIYYLAQDRTRLFVQFLYLFAFVATFVLFKFLYALLVIMVFVSIRVYISRRNARENHFPIYHHYTFRDVDSLSDDYCQQLRSICNNKKHVRCLLLTPITLPELFPLAVGLIKGGMQMIVLGPHETGYAQFVRWLPKLNVDVIITTPFLFLVIQILSLVLGPFIRLRADHVIYMHNDFGILNILTRILFFSQRFHAFRDPSSAAGSIEMSEYPQGATLCITNTTGSTGNPKLVHITHDMVQSQIESFTEMVKPFRQNEKQQDSCLSTNTVMTICINCMGLTAIMPPVNVTKLGAVDPDLYLWSVDKFKPRFAFCSPIVWNKVINHISQPGYKSTRLAPPLELLLCGGAPVSLAQHRRLKEFCCDGEKAREKVELFTPYGATEALPLCVIGTNEILLLSDTNYNGQRYGMGGVCVGRTCRNVTLKLQWSDVWSGDVKLPPNAAEIWVSGKAVSPKYEMDDVSNAKFKRIDDNGRLWHCTGDVGYSDEENRIWFCGRRSHMFVLQDNTAVTPVCIEQLFLNHFPDRIRRCALVGYGPVDNKYKTALLVVEPYDWSNCPPKKDLVACFTQDAPIIIPYWYDLLKNHMAYSISKNPLPVDPRHNSKIERIKITRIYKDIPVDRL
jgi:long-subunit acyl-CoA synthetase (AMP-forming)